MSPGFEEAWRLEAHRDPRRRAGRDHVARQQRHELADIADDVLDAEDQVGGVAVLPPLAVDLGRYLELAGVAHLVGGDQPRPERAERVAALALGPLPAALHLVFALGDVVDDAIAGDVLPGVLDVDVARGRADDDAELDLVIGLLRALGDDHVVIGAADAAGRLHEEDRLRWDRHAGLLRVQPVVEPDRDDFRHRADARPEPRRAGNQRQAWRDRAGAGGRARRARGPRRRCRAPSRTDRGSGRCGREGRAFPGLAGRSAEASSGVPPGSGRYEI